jgi:hypothetical protein
MNPNFHHVPGRLRVRVASLKRNDSAARATERWLSGIEGITAGRVNDVTGSVTITYEPQLIALPQLLELLAERGHVPTGLTDGGADRFPGLQAVEASASRAGQALATATLSFVVEKVIERSALALIGALV